MVKIYLHTTIYLLLFAIVLSAQGEDKISKKNRELNNLKQEISQLEKQLNSKSKKERESVQALSEISQQSLLLNKLINNLLYEERTKEKQIRSISSEVDKINGQIDELRKNYANYVVWIYKNRDFSMLKFLIGAESINQAVLRYKFLNSITEQKQHTLNELKDRVDELNKLSVDLSEQVRQKDLLVEQKKNEKGVLTQKETERKNLIGILKKDQKSIAKEIEDKRKAEIEIKNIIADLIEKERERKSRLRTENLSSKQPVRDYTYDNFEDFSSLKGQLSWPVKQGKIVRKFGENKNAKLKTVTLNYGIDVDVKKETDVHAVAEGIVSAIDWLPGYGSVVIVTHKDEYRTVYGHITDLNVNEGDKIKAGTVIGKVNDSLEGTILHFEIWSGRNYQNPETWLARGR